MQRAVSPRLPETAVDVEQVAPEIVVRYVQDTAQEPAIQPARRFAIMGAQMNVLVVNEPAPMTVLVDANMGVRPAAKILVRGVTLHAQLPAPTIVREYARGDAIQPAHTTS